MSAGLIHSLHGSGARRAAAAVATLAVAGACLSACDNGPDVGGSSTTQSSASAGSSQDGESSASPAAAAESATITTNVRRGSTDVPVDRVLKVGAQDGTLSSVAVTGAGDVGELAGAVGDDGSTWTAASRLEPGTQYSITADLANDDGDTVTRTSSFTTQALSLDQQTYASVSPLAGQTVGVGMPVIVHFDVPVTDPAAFEKHMSVTTTPAQPGSWSWISDTEAHYRPKTYWQAGTKVDVHIDVNGVAAGNGIYGQEDRDVSFAIGDANVYKVNTKTDQMQVFSNGKLLRTIPVTTGLQPDYTTRSGTKVIMEKFESKDMNSETVGITGADAYNIQGVQWAMRLTNSGEFIHAAPWSVGSQGHANVSHGCTGMSTDNADWLFHMTNVGDPVEYTGTDRSIEPGNGYSDWNVPWQQYKAGSALAKG